MTHFTPWAGLTGGILIGLSAVLLTAAYGRIFLAGGVHRRAAPGRMPVLGLFDTASIDFSGGPVRIVAGGLIVGFGTALGAGCTSGHGIIAARLVITVAPANRNWPRAKAEWPPAEPPGNLSSGIGLTIVTPASPSPLHMPNLHWQEAGFAWPLRTSRTTGNS